MKKRILAVICMLSVFLCIMALGKDTQATTQSYLVGYGIRDINPWVDPNDHSKGILPVALTGNGNDYERTCTGLMDDNDDGEVGEGDGVYTTATAVTDPYGKTMIYITIDSLQGYQLVADDASSAIVKTLGSDVIAADQIIVNANHTHSGPYYAGHKNSSTPEFKAYYAYVVQQITDAAVEAYNDRAEAVMRRGSIDATESTAYLGYNGGKGYHMNAIRHYDVVSKKGNVSSLFYKYHVAGSNFGGMSTTMKGYTQVSRENALESDNTMYVLLFDFPNNAEKEPVIFVNWRAHSTTNSGGTNKTFVSGDFANSIRANMKKAGYRAAFFQGASGNVVTKSTQHNDWTAECYKEYGNYNANTNVYGRILTNIALDCVDRSMTEILPAGEIRHMRITYKGELQQDSDGYLAAAKAYQAACAELGENKFAAIPYSYTHSDGKTYIINSKFHANSIVNRSKASSSYTDIDMSVVIMGGNVAFVTGPGELADRYDLAGSTKNEDNDWYELITEAYGMPFVLGYTNNSRGYIPFSLEYTYNTDEYGEITGKKTNGDEFFAPGSYESNTSRFARGTGEALVQKYKQMLSILQDEPRVAYCEACKAEVEWTPLIAEQAKIKYLGTGHYYLIEDQKAGARAENQKIISADQKLCYDLNGHTVEAEGRNFSLSGNNATLNIMDSAGGGKVISYPGGNNVGGGVVLASGSTTQVNIYGGTLQFIRRDVAKGVYETGNGGVISSSGTVNMYGGTLIGGELRISKYYSPSSIVNGCGATVYTSGRFNAYGGRIVAGKAADGARGDCIYVVDTSGKVYLSGDAQVDEIYLNKNDGKRLTVKDAFTGKAAVYFNPDNVTMASSTDVGNSSSGSFGLSNLYCTSHSQWQLVVDGTNLRLASYDTAQEAVINTAEGVTTYTDLADAISAYQTGHIVLLKDITSEVAVGKDVYLDLNGKTISGKVTVAEGKTLYCMDSATDDYTVADGMYGKLTNVSGTVAAVSESASCAVDGYLMLQGEEGISFHRVNLRLSTVALRTEDVGLYYKSSFAADEMVAEKVIRFGVALSLKGEPTTENIKTDCAISWFTGFAAGKAANAGDGTSTIVKRIMRSDLETETNAFRADMQIYGRAYILLDDGTYLFGAGASRSLHEQMELVNRMWEDSGFTQAKKDAAVALYKAYESVMSSWSIAKIIEAATPAE